MLRPTGTDCALHACLATYVTVSRCQCQLTMRLRPAAARDPATPATPSYWGSRHSAGSVVTYADVGIVCYLVDATRQERSALLLHPARASSPTCARGCHATLCQAFHFMYVARCCLCVLLLAFFNGYKALAFMKYREQA